MFFAFFPCNHSPATSISEHISSSLAPKDMLLSSEIEKTVTKNFEGIFHIPD